MKILILTVSTGYGHHATANALAESLRARSAQVEVVDIYEKISRLFKEGLSKGYLMTLKYMKSGYRIAYRYLERRAPISSEYSINNLVNALMGMKFSSFIYDYAPDVIVCTHVFAAQILNEIKRRGRLPIPVVGIVTDYTLPPIWADISLIEHIVIPSDVFIPRFTKQGIAPHRIRPYGIPVQRKFSTKLPKAEARKKLGLAPDRATLLIMSGSMGHGSITKATEQIRAIPLDFQSMVVCGTNHQEYLKLTHYHSQDFQVYGFVDNIDEMMDAADIIITKPGGLTVSEALAKELPMILRAPIPGHEERNVEFLLNGGMAIHATKTYPMDEGIYQLLQNPRRLALMEESIRLYHKPRASEDIADFVVSLAGGSRLGTKEQ